MNEKSRTNKNFYRSSYWTFLACFSLCNLRVFWHRFVFSVYPMDVGINCIGSQCNIFYCRIKKIDIFIKNIQLNEKTNL